MLVLFFRLSSVSGTFKVNFDRAAFLFLLFFPLFDFDSSSVQEERLESIVWLLNVGSVRLMELTKVFLEHTLEKGVY